MVSDDAKESAKALKGIGEDEKAAKLVTEILAGKVTDISPRLDFASDLGFNYPAVEQALGIKGQEVLETLESLASQGILKKTFFDKFLHCPQCQSVNLRPTLHCPKCNSGNINRGRVLEHLVCGYLGLEDEFISAGRLICPKCQIELQTIDSDYRSRGLMRKCYNCGEVFSTPLIKWRCLKCSSLTSEDGVTEVSIYAYRFNEAKRNWLQFELKPKSDLIEFLQDRGYEVAENTTVNGRSGAEHTIDILASRDDGIITHRIAIGVKIAEDRLSLKDIFEFDDKAYDIGIHDKVLITLSELDKEAAAFASHQWVKVIKIKDLETLLASATKPAAEITKKAFEFKSRAELLEYLRERGYEVKENARIQGRSGAEHTIDILASRDDGIITHNIAIGIETSEAPVELGKVFGFDDKAYDAGIHDKVFIAAPKLSREASLFAARQRIRVYETGHKQPS